jgi:hypothetical protein
MRAAAWLTKAQHKNGSWGGGTTTPGPNTNSTGIAAQALGTLAGHRDEVRKARGYVASMQLTPKRAHGRTARDLGAIAYNRAALRKALKNGIQKVERDQFRRASAQAIFAFLDRPLLTLRVP